MFPCAFLFFCDKALARLAVELGTVCYFGLTDREATTGAELMWLQTNCCVVSWWLDSCYVLFPEHHLCRDRNEEKVVDLWAAEHLQTF